MKKVNRRSFFAIAAAVAITAVAAWTPDVAEAKRLNFTEATYNKLLKSGHSHRWSAPFKMGDFSVLFS